MLTLIEVESIPRYGQPVAAFPLHLLPPEDLLSASDMMILGLFPPSSRVTLLRLLLPAAIWIRWPTCGEAETHTSSQQQEKGTTCFLGHRPEDPHNLREQLDYKRPEEFYQISSLTTAAPPL